MKTVLALFLFSASVVAAPTVVKINVGGVDYQMTIVVDPWPTPVPTSTPTATPVLKTTTVKWDYPLVAAGFNLYYGSIPTQLSHKFSIGGNIRTAPGPSLPPGTYYFTLTALLGPVESPPSSVYKATL